MNLFGTKIRELRESQELLLRQVAAQLDIDTALLSKIERGDRRAHREHVIKIAKILATNKDELIILWLADKLQDIIENEPLANKALDLLHAK
jgi:transcriptional regulator with XRE-family HTH domain